MFLFVAARQLMGYLFILFHMCGKIQFVNRIKHIGLRVLWVNTRVVPLSVSMFLEDRRGSLLWRFSWFITLVCRFNMIFRFVPSVSVSSVLAFPAQVSCGVSCFAVCRGLVCFCIWSIGILFFTLSFLLFTKSFPAFFNDVPWLFTMSPNVFLLLDVLWLSFFFTVVVVIAIVRKCNSLSVSNPFIQVFFSRWATIGSYVPFSS